MTETYGYWCHICRLRYRSSLCKRTQKQEHGPNELPYTLICPSGHDLTVFGVWVYRQTTKHRYNIRISHNGKRVFEESIRHDLLGAYIQLWKNEVRDRRLSYVLIGAIDSLREPSSISDKDWRIKCRVCKHSAPKSPNDPFLPKDFDCARQVCWKSIWCEDYEYGPEYGHQTNIK